MSVTVKNETGAPYVLVGGRGNTDARTIPDQTIVVVSDDEWLNVPIELRAAGGLHPQTAGGSGGGGGAVTIADGDDQALGSTTDAAATGNGTLIGITKQVRALLSSPLSVDGSGHTQPVSGTFWQATQPVSAASLPLPSGAATAAAQVSAQTTLSSISTQLAGTLSVTGSFSITQTDIRADYDSGAGTQNLTMWGLALPASGGAVAGGTATNPIRTDPTGTTTQPVSGSVSVSNLPGTQPVSGTVAVSNFPVTQPVSGTFWQATQPVSGTFWQATQPVSGTVTANIGTSGSLALDATLTGGSQKTKLVDSAGTNLAAISAAGALKVDGSAVTQPVSGTFFQATQPVSGTVAVSNFPGTQPVSGIVTANAGTGTFAVSAASLPLPTGASTAAKQPALGIAGTPSADVLTVQGVASMTALKVDGSGVTQPVSGTFFQATQPVSGTVAVSNFPATQPVSGTVTANAGTGTMAVSLAAAATSIAHAEDAATADQDVGVGNLFKRLDNPSAAAASTSTDGDYTLAISDGVGRQRVTVVGEMLPTISGSLTAAQATPGTPVAGGTVSATVPASGNATITVSGTYGAASVILFEASDDSGTTWFPITAVREDTQAPELTSRLAASTTRSWAVSLLGFTTLRVRMTTFVSGSMSIRITAGGIPVEPVIPPQPVGRAIFTATATGAAVGTSGTEALVTLTPGRDFVTSATGTSLTVTAGKRLRLVGFTMNLTGNATATAASDRAILRVAIGGAVTTSSPPVAILSVNTPATASFMQGASITFFDAPIDLPDNAQVGISQLPRFTTNAPTLDVTLVGYEY